MINGTTLNFETINFPFLDGEDLDVGECAKQECQRSTIIVRNSIMYVYGLQQENELYKCHDTASDCLNIYAAMDVFDRSIWNYL